MININSKSWIRKVLLALTFLSLTSAVIASDLNEQLRGAFGGMVNVTKGRELDTGRRGGVVGPSVYYRAPRGNEPLVGFAPPSLKAGCKGVDFFGGSLSFISHREFQNLMRSIAANATGYAFQLAVNAACPSCGKLMQELQEKVNSLNQFTADSCAAGKMLVDSSGLGNQIEGFMDKVSLDWGQRTGEGKSESLGVVPPNTTSPAKPPVESKAPKEAFEGNVIFTSLHTTRGGLSLLGEGPKDEAARKALYETMMSLVGTVILVKGQSKDGSEERVNTNSKDHTIELSNLIDGGSFDIYECGSEVDTQGRPTCVTMNTVKRDVKGIKKRIEEAFNGVNGSRGILSKLRGKNGLDEFTTAEKELIAAMSPAAFSMLRDFMSDTETVYSIIQVLADSISRDYSTRYVIEVIDAAETAVMANDAPLRVEVMKKLDSRRSSIAAQSKALADKERENWEILKAKQAIKDSLKKASKKNYVG